MIRLVFILVVALLVGLGAAWLADHDGVLTLMIAGYEIRTSAAFAVVILILLTVVLFLLVQLAVFIVGGPSKLNAFLSGRRARKAWHALSRGLIAAAADDTSEAVQAARHAESFLGEQPMTLLLSAHAAELSGDAQKQEAVYRTMLAHPETEFLGLRKLSALAMRRANSDEALSHALRAFALRPKAPHAAEALFQIRIARREWAEAEALLAQAIEAKLLNPESERRWRAALSAERVPPEPQVFQA